MEGYLHKWVNYLYGWKLRYFILHNGVLHYCQDKGFSRKGAIHLNVAHISLHDKNPRRFSIDSGCTVIHLKAASSDLAKMWVQVLKAEKDTLMQEECFRERSLTQPDVKEEGVVTDVLIRLSELQANIEEELDAVPAKLQDPMFARVIQLCKEYKVRARQYTMANAFRLLETEKERYREAYQQLDEKCEDFRRSVDTDVVDFIATRNKGSASPFDTPGFHEITESKLEESLDFKDAKSHLSESAIFYDAGDGNTSILLTDTQHALTPYRKSLPFLRNPGQKYNIWKIVKDSIGKELSKMAVPVYFNEPISFLQRFSEDLLYNDLLIKAGETKDQWLRLAYIACFAVSGYSVTSYRVMKPFNPLLGETFELVRDGFKLISEQVSHHPPITALHCDHSKFTFWGSTEVKTSFKGVFLLVHPAGLMHVLLKSTGEEFVWSKPNSSVHNIIFGKMYVDHHGVMEIRNQQTGDVCKISMKKRGWFDGDPNKVEGGVYDSLGQVRYILSGKWSEFIDIKNAFTGEEFTGWRIRPFQEGFEWNYYFTDYTIQLNMPPDMFTTPIPKTDSRYRPDQRALENGDLNTAVSEKLRVEEKQRTVRREMEARGETWNPLWFHEVNDEWVFAGRYWEEKDRGSFRPVPDIF